LKITSQTNPSLFIIQSPNICSSILPNQQCVLTVKFKPMNQAQNVVELFNISYTLNEIRKTNQIEIKASTDELPQLELHGQSNWQIPLVLGQSKTHKITVSWSSGADIMGLELEGLGGDVTVSDTSTCKNNTILN